MLEEKGEDRVQRGKSTGGLGQGHGQMKQLVRGQADKIRSRRERLFLIKAKRSRRRLQLESETRTAEWDNG